MRRATLLAVAALAAATFACSGTGEVPDRPAVREAHVERLLVRDQDFVRFTAVAPVHLPAQQATRARHAKWEVLVEGEVVEKGEGPLSVDVPTGGGVVEVAVQTRYGTGDKLAAILEMEKPLSLIMRGSVHTEDGTEWTFQRAGQLRGPRVPVVQVWHVEAGAFPDDNEISLVFHVQVENRNPFEIQLEQLLYDLSINGQRLIEQGIAGRKARVPPASVAQLEIPLTLSASNFPQVRDALRKRVALEYTLDGIVRLGVGRIPVALEGPIALGGD